MEPDAIPLALQLVVLAGDYAATMQQIIEALPTALGLAVIVACSDPEALASLRPISALPVVDVRGRVRLQHDRVFVVPPHHEAVVDGGELVVAGAQAPGSVDALLRSLADQHGRDATAVILDGQGSSGALGIKRIKEAGG